MSNNLGKPIFNLVIKPKLRRKLGKADLDLIEAIGHTITAIKHLLGDWIVTNEGFLLRDQKKSLKKRFATIDIMEAPSEWVLLQRFIAGEIESPASLPHFHYDNDEMGRINYDKKKKAYLIC